VVWVLFKMDPPGFFERSYPRLLEMNNWQSINQEILWGFVVTFHASCPGVLCGVADDLWHVYRISTPRRFGKTISVCLFVAALVFVCPRVEISIYSTCE